MKREIIIIVLKVIIAIATAILGVLGVTSFASCSVGHSVYGDGRATIITTDTTIIQHDGYVKFSK